MKKNPAKGHPSHEYALGVLSGDVPACQLAKQSCQRFLDDLKRSDLTFDVTAAERPAAFIETLRHYKGRYAGAQIKLEPWQRFIIANLFGFFRADDGLRRFKYAHIEIPRKNGKTLLAAGIAIYLLCADGEAGAEIYNAATKKDQAMLLHKDARVLIQKSADQDFRGAFEIRKNPAVIEYPNADGFMKPLGRDSDGDTTDGLNPHGIIADETHAWASHPFWNVLNSALGARDQPLFLQITTAGHGQDTVGHTHHKIARRILSGEDGGTGDDYFAIIHTIDDGDDIESPATWEKANPLYGITVDEKKFKSQLALAGNDPYMMAETKVKWLNIWLSSAAGWLNMEEWDKNALDFDLDKLEGLRCYGGLDLAITRDLSAMVLCFPPQDFLERWTLVSHFWCPANDIQTRSKRDKVPYLSWAEKGFIVPTPGDVMDHGYIVKELLQAADLYDLRSVGYDRAYSTAIISPLVDEGLDMLAFSQGILTISPCAKEFERLLISERINHFNHPVLRWCAGNTVIKQDANGNIKPDKKRSTERIDGTIAAIMAMAVAIEGEYEGGDDPFAVTVVG